MSLLSSVEFSFRMSFHSCLPLRPHFSDSDHLLIYPAVPTSDPRMHRSCQLLGSPLKLWLDKLASRKSPVLLKAPPHPARYLTCTVFRTYPHGSHCLSCSRPCSFNINQPLKNNPRVGSIARLLLGNPWPFPGLLSRFHSLRTRSSPILPLYFSSVFFPWWKTITFKASTGHQS